VAVPILKVETPAAIVPHEELVLLAAEADGRCVSPTPRTTMKGR
jgi:hypothetical protein